MNFRGEKIFYFNSLFWVVFFTNLSLSIFFEAFGQDQIIWEKYKIEKSRKDPNDTKLKKQSSDFEANDQDEIILEKYKLENLQEDFINLDVDKKSPTWRNRSLRFSFEEINLAIITNYQPDRTLRSVRKRCIKFWIFFINRVV